MPRDEKLGRIVVQVHYHPSGSPQVDDATSVQLRRYQAGIPEYIGALELLQLAARLPVRHAHSPERPTLEPGAVLALRCTSDNSLSNGFVQAALREQGLTKPRDVALGEETLDEMCLGSFGIAQKVSDLLGQ